MSRYMTTETIRKMDREELETELYEMGEAYDDTGSDDQLRDVLCRALDAIGERKRD